MISFFFTISELVIYLIIYFIGNIFIILISKIFIMLQNNLKPTISIHQIKSFSYPIHNTNLLFTNYELYNRISAQTFQEKNYPSRNEKLYAFSYASTYAVYTYASFLTQYPTIEPTFFSPKPFCPSVFNPQPSNTSLVIQHSNTKENNNVLLISLCICITTVLFFAGLAYKLRVLLYRTWFGHSEFSAHSNFGVTLDNIAPNELQTNELPNESTNVELFAI